MSSHDASTITPGLSANNRGDYEPRLPTRRQLSAARLLERGRRGKADLWLLDSGDGPLVVKDFARKNFWFRLLGRLQIGREVRAYGKMGVIRGVPRLVGRIDAYALAIEKIDGVPLRYADRPHENGAAKLADLRRILESIHGQGLVHWDLRSMDNVLVTRAGKIAVLDFASAVWLPPGSLSHRLLFRWFQKIDESAYLKWKQILGAGPYSAQEITLLKRHRFWRSLWVFNPRTRKEASVGQGGGVGSTPDQ